VTESDADDGEASMEAGEAFGATDEDEPTDADPVSPVEADDADYLPTETGSGIPVAAIMTAVAVIGALVALLVLG
jgi:hypothetical protein